MKFILLTFFPLYLFNVLLQDNSIAISYQSELVETKDIPSYEVNKIYPPFSIQREKLSEISTIMDINKHFKPSWIREYHTVELKAIVNGELKIVEGNNENFNTAQKDLIANADVEADIEVLVKYTPENTLSHNDPKLFEFSFTIDPEKDASFPGGTGELEQYLKRKAIDKIPANSFQDFDLSAIKFTIGKDGQIVDAHLFWESDNKEVDDLLLDVICDMPNWTPASYSNGLKVKQEFALTVGNMQNCAINLLNLR